MGMYSDNFYSWLEKVNHTEKTAMDSATNGWKHPDGKPCRASKPENCPFYKKSVTIEETISYLDSHRGKDKNEDEREARHLRELLRIMSSKRYQQRFEEIIGHVPSFSSLEGAYEDLKKEMENWKRDEKTMIKDARAKRDKVYNSHLGDPDYQYASCDIETGDKKKLTSGWGVTFQTTSTENPNHGNYLTDDEYDEKVTMMRDIFGSSPMVGIFEGKPEISFNCQSTLRSLAAMVMFEQKAIFGFKHGKDILNKTFSKRDNSIKRPQEK